MKTSHSGDNRASSTITATPAAQPPPSTPDPTRRGDQPAVSGLLAGLGEFAAAATIGVVVALVGVVAVSSIRWPAFTTSHVLRALTTTGQVAALVMIVAAFALTRGVLTSKPGPVPARWIARAVKVLSCTGIAGFVSITLGMPLAATHLYLDGLSPQAQWRTEMLTRFADSPAWRDETYLGLPPHTAAGWYWLGGRLAAVSGTAGWESFKLYAVGSIVVAAVLALVWWSRLIRADIAIVMTTATTAVALAYSASDPAHTFCLLLLPPALVTAWSALHAGVGDAETADSAAGSAGGVPVYGVGRAGLVGVGVFLGVCAVTDIAAATITLIAVTLMAVSAGVKRPDAGRRAGAGAVFRRWLVIVAVAAIPAALAWGRYLGQRSDTGAPDSMPPWPTFKDAARTVLPVSGSLLIVGLCLLGAVWLVLRARSSALAPALGIGILATWLAWVLVHVTTLGMADTAARSTVYVVLAGAGVFAVIDALHWVGGASRNAQPVRRSVAAIGLLGALAFSQQIPDVLGESIAAAYTDTDGDGTRADGFPVSAAANYTRIDDYLTTEAHRPRGDSVVLTGDPAMLAIYPYTGFLAQSARYSNPVADYPARMRQVTDWAAARSTDELIDLLDHSPRPAPTVFVLRRLGSDYVLRLATDRGSDNGVGRTYATIEFPSALFDSAHFDHTDIGPFTVLIRR